MISRLGVLGGMFDPVHKGHVRAAKFARQLLSLDIVKMIPCHIPNHRNLAASNTKHRSNMLRLAIESDRGLEVDDIESDNDDVSYTLETLRSLQARKPSSSMILILGMDSFNSLPEWFKWEELFSLCSFCVLPRANLKIDKATYRKLDLERKLVSSVTEFYEERAGKVIVAEDFYCDSSSSEIRSELDSDYCVASNLDEKVWSYIQKHDLYKENDLGNNH